MICFACSEDPPLPPNPPPSPSQPTILLLGHLSLKRAWDPDRYGSWRWPQAITKLRRRNVPLPARYASAADDPHCSTQTNGKLYQIWLSPIAKQVERHHFPLLAYRCAKSLQIFDLFDFFAFSILNRMVSKPSTLPHSYDIETPVDAQYGRSEAPKLGFTSNSLVAAPTSPVAPFWTCGEGNLGILRDLVNMAMRDGTLRAASVLIGRFVYSIAVALPT